MKRRRPPRDAFPSYDFKFLALSALVILALFGIVRAVRAGFGF